MLVISTAPQLRQLSMAVHPQPARPAPPVPSHSSHGHTQSRGRERERTERAEREQRERDRGPQIIGDYEIVRTLGTGSFGKVKRELCSVVNSSAKRSLDKFRQADSMNWIDGCTMDSVARHKLTGHHVAMKFISKRKISSKELAFSSYSNLLLRVRLILSREITECPIEYSEKFSTSRSLIILTSSNCQCTVLAILDALFFPQKADFLASFPTFHTRRYDVMQTPEYIVMVIEYLEGELFDYIVKRGRVRLFVILTL